MAMLVSALAYGQNLTVTGVVTDSATGEGVPFASLQIKGTMTGTSTDGDGYYSISVPAEGVLIFSSVGYITQEVAVSGKAVHDVALAPDTQAIEETIVVAFGTATKESFTGSATVVKSDDIAKVQASDATRALEGVVAGVQMTTASGSLGATPTIQIRGVSSISAGTAPLYVIDGVPYPGDMNNINPADIESMTVLKDAASNALYGARGANGVIMITTKKARSRDAVVTFDAKVGVNTKALKEYDFVTDPGTYYEMHYDALKNYYMDSGMSSPEAHYKVLPILTGDPSDGGLGYNIYTLPKGQSLIGTNGKLNPAAQLGRIVTYDGQDYYLTSDNWMDEAYKNSIRQEYNLSVSGSNEQSSFYTSFGYLDNVGIIDGSDMQRYTARLRADYQAKSWLKVGANASYTHFNFNNGNGTEGSSDTGNVFAFANSVAPIYPLYLRDGAGNIMKDSYGYTRYDFGNGMNAGMTRPVQYNSNAFQMLNIDVNNSEGNAFNGTAFADIKFLKDFTFTFNVGVGLDETRGTSMSNYLYGQFVTDGGTLSKSHSRMFHFNMQQLLNWSRTFAGVHNFSVLLGHENYSSKSYGVSAFKKKLFSLDNLELGGAIIDGQGANSSFSEYNNEGYFLRAQYDFANRIFLSASYRRDASSRFHPDHRWGNFWSVGGGWIVNQEDWFPSAPWIDMLKLKASIGSQGNDSIGSYLYTDLYSVGNSSDELAVVFGSKGNEDITWETNTNFNAGADFEFLRGRLSGSVEYFYRLTSDMLFWFNVPVSLGYSGYYDNIGDMRNQGIEFAFNYDLIRKQDMNWSVYFNATHYTNKITMLPAERKLSEVEGYKGYASGNRFVGEGLALNTFYFKKYAGVEPTTGLPMWYKDVKGEDGSVTRETTTTYTDGTDYLCGDPIPDLYGGFGTSFAYKDFDFSVQFTYSIGGLAYDSGYASLMDSPGNSIGSNFHKDLLQAWTPDNPNSEIPRFQYLDQNISGTSDRFLTDASYLNVQNAQIGYTLPQRFTQKFNVSRVRFYAACDNIWYWSRRQGLDPRQSLTGATSDTMNSPVRTISAGMNITF